MNPPHNSPSVVKSCQRVDYDPISQLMGEFLKLLDGVIILQIVMREAKVNEVFGKAVRGPATSVTGAGPGWAPLRKVLCIPNFLTIVSTVCISQLLLHKEHPQKSQGPKKCTCLSI